MKHLKWSMSRENKSIDGVCRTVGDVHALLQKFSQILAADIVIEINRVVMSRDKAITHALELVESEQAKYEQTHRAIYVKTGACSFAANRKKVWVKR